MQYQLLHNNMLFNELKGHKYEVSTFEGKW